MPRPFSASRFLTGYDPAREAWRRWMEEGGPLPSYPAESAFEDDELRAVLCFLDFTLHCEAPLTKTGRSCQTHLSHYNRDRIEELRKNDAACLQILDRYFTKRPLTRKQSYNQLAAMLCDKPIWEDFDPTALQYRLRTQLLPKLLPKKFPSLGFKPPKPATIRNSR